MQLVKFAKFGLLALSAAGLMACTSADLARQATTPTAAATAGSFTFGLWGDMPYKKAGDDPKLPAVLRSINASDIAFSIYDGDIKDGSSKCTDDVYTSALTLFNTLRQPVVYVPGDNEWTDCHRTNKGSIDPIERLGHLRRVLFASPLSLGQNTMALAHQGKPGEPYVENTRFSHGGVTFAGFNMPGSNNNFIANPKQCSSKSQRSAADCDKANAEFIARDAANSSWLKETFEQARSSNAKGLVLVVQGEPGFDVPETEEADESTRPEVIGYRSFMTTLTQETERFKGQVLFVHGDMHVFKVDKPLYSPLKPMANFTRLATFGSPSLHWVKVTVKPDTVNVFQIEPVWVNQP